MKWSALLIDDERFGLEALRKDISRALPDVEIVGMAQSIPEGQNLLLQKQPNLLFLDLNLPIVSGIDFLQSIEDPSFYIIVTTAYSDEIAKAIQFGAHDYLLKPVRLKRLQEVYDRARHFARSNKRFFRI